MEGAAKLPGAARPNRNASITKQAAPCLVSVGQGALCIRIRARYSRKEEEVSEACESAKCEMW